MDDLMTVDVSKYEPQKVTASRELLNDLCCALTMTIKGYRHIGCHALAEHYKDMHDRIFRELADSGYYDDLFDGGDNA